MKASYVCLTEDALVYSAQCASRLGNKCHLGKSRQQTESSQLAAHSSQLSAYILQLTYMRLALFKGKQEESKMKYGTYMQHFGLQVSKRLLSLISKYITNSGFTALLNQCICV